jgi:hypothetical protein
MKADIACALYQQKPNVDGVEYALELMDLNENENEYNDSVVVHDEDSTHAYTPLVSNIYNSLMKTPFIGPIAKTYIPLLPTNCCKRNYKNAHSTHGINAAHYDRGINAGSIYGDEDNPNNPSNIEKDEILESFSDDDDNDKDLNAKKKKRVNKSNDSSSIKVVDDSGEQKKDDEDKDEKFDIDFFA